MNNLIRQMWIDRLLLRIPHRFRLFVRFGFAGVAATIFYIITVNILLLATTATPLFASITAYLISLGFSYLLQSRFTFHKRLESSAQFFKFLVTAVVGLVVSTATMYVITDIFFGTSCLGTVAVSMLIPIVNFFVFKFWVFKFEHETTPLYDARSHRDNF